VEFNDYWSKTNLRYVPKLCQEGKFQLSNGFTTAALEPRSHQSDQIRSVIGFGVWSWIAAILVIYGSLIPFDFHVPNLQARLATAARTLDFRAALLDDVGINVLLYIPLGALFAISLRKTGVRFGAAFFAVVMAAGISIAVEMLQIFLPSRVPSMLDVVLNIGGASAGAISACLFMGQLQRVLNFAIAEFNRQPTNVAVIAITSALLLQAATPFDFITTTSGLHDVLRRASQASLGTLAPASSTAPTAMISQFAMAGWFALLGFLATLNEGSTKPAVLICSAALRSAVLVALMEMIGLFRSSHTFDASIVFLRILSAAFGAWCAAFVWNRGYNDCVVRSSRVPTGWLIACGGLLVLTMIAQGSSSGHSPAMHAAASRFEIRLPFEALWQSSSRSCVSSLLIGLMDYAALTVIGLTILRRLSVQRANSITALLTIGVAMTQSLHSLSPFQAFDFTIPIYAGFISLVTAQCTSWPQSIHRSTVNQELVGTSFASI